MTIQELKKDYFMTQTEAEKAEMLLLWFNNYPKTDSRFIPMDEFDKRYKWLFRERALFYSWGPFIRDHGFVCLRTAKGRGL